MVGLAFALWGNALLNLGVDSEPATEGGPSPAKAVAVTGSAIGAITLIFMSAFLVIAAPLGTEEPAIKVQLLFSAISGMYGLQFLGTAVVQVMEWDARIIGNIALLGVPLQLAEMLLLWKYADDAGISTAHLIFQELVLLSFSTAGLAIWLGTHGKIPGRTVGVALLFALLGTLYFLFFSGGLLTPPGMSTAALSPHLVIY